MTCAIPPLQLSQAIIAAFSERTVLGHEKVSIASQRIIDASLANYHNLLADLPISRWLALYQGIGPIPCLAAAATHCSGFGPQQLQPFLIQTGWQSAPWNEVHIASQFAKTSCLLPEDRKLSLASLMKLSGNEPAIAAFLVGACESPPHYDIKQPIREIDPAIASLLLFLWARVGVGVEQTNLLFDYLKHQDTPAEPRFWASFTAVLRFPHLHDKTDYLLSLAGDDPIRNKAATALVAAIGEGALTPEEALWLYENHNEGALDTRFVRSLRLATFVPGACPMIDVFAPCLRQEKQAENVKTAIEQAISSGASFTPTAYLERERRTRAVKTEADKRAQKIKERVVPRGLNEAMITEALENEPGLPVSGYPYGAALLRFHPESVLPIVSCAETGEVIHLGRADYLYGIDMDALKAMPEQERPQLPPFYERKPSAPDLQIVYVRLKEEWIDVWRPVEARWFETNIYCLMPREIPGDEWQQFWIGHHVECTVRRLGNAVVQVATKLAERK